MALCEAASDLGLQKLRHYHSLVAIEAGDDAGPETETFIGPEGDNRESWQVSYERSKAIAAQRRLEYNVYLFKAVFRYIRVLDAGPSYRIFVWVPMLLQVFELGVCSCSVRVGFTVDVLAGNSIFSCMAGRGIGHDHRVVEGTVR